MIPYGQDEVTREDILNVTSVLNSNHLTQGKMVPNFEDACFSSNKGELKIVTTHF